MDSIPRIRKHDDANRSSGGDGGRHQSSRDYYGSRDDRRDRDRDGYRERRRSRSPHHRSSRHEADSYSSSRDYRAREREDRYTREPRRDERNWDRERGDRDRDRDRMRRRDDDDRRGGGGGRDRDPYDRGDRRGGGGPPRGGGPRGGGGDRDEFAMQAGARRRSASPPKKREPTPDLTDTVPILSRKRRLTQWDIKPPGYENVTAEQAKLSGMFPLPGAPRQQAMDPSKLQSMLNQTDGGADRESLKPSNARQSKRLFLHNIPPTATEESIVSFLNLQLNGLNIITSNDPCISCQMSKTKDFALVEFKNPSEATMALALDGVSMEPEEMQNGDGTNGAASGLNIRRPKDYIVAGASEEEPPIDGVVSSDVKDTPNKLSITNLLPTLDDEQVKELVSAFGALRSFVLVKDRSTEESRGIAFCEFVEKGSADMAVDGLNGMDLGGKSIKVQRASIGVAQAEGLEMSVNAMSMLAGTQSDNVDEGRVLQLLNMVTAEELINDEDYEEIVDDVKEECEKYGQVVDIKVPRPSLGSRQSNGVGKIYIKYDNADSARKALQSLAGRKFADRTVVTTYFSEESFEVNAW